MLDRALEWTFSRYAIDQACMAVGGFSDGASYALSLGITNGDLFTHVLAFSPGFVAPAAQRGSPRIFVSHGLKLDGPPAQSRILPDRSSFVRPNIATYSAFERPHGTMFSSFKALLPYGPQSPRKARGDGFAR